MNMYSNRSAFSWALGALFEHVGLWLGLVLIRLVVMFAFLFSLVLPLIVPLQMFAPWLPFSQQEGPLFLLSSFVGTLTMSQLLLAVILCLVLSFLFAAIWVGGVAVSLEIRDRGTSSFGRFWNAALMYAWRGWLLLLILTFVLKLTALFFIVPAVYFWMRLQFSPVVLVDLDCSWKDAIAASWRMTTHRVGPLLITNLLFLLIGITLWSTPWLLFFAYPLVVLVRTYLYRDESLSYRVVEEMVVVATVE